MEIKHLEKQANGYVQAHGRKKRWHKVVTALGAVVVFCTTYALIMPAVTIHSKTYCGLEKHEHSDKCYEEVTKLVCTLSEEGHIHTDACYEEESVLTINPKVTGGHIHNDSCYEEHKVLICEEGGHQHDDDCYEEHKKLICEEEETDGHQHDDDCYEEHRTLICEEEETDGHQHGKSCYEEHEVLVCEEEETDGHTHGSDCYEEESVLACKNDDPEHEHDDSCYKTKRVLVCELEECKPHHHGKDCYETERELICELEECEPHHHDDDCYETERELICELEEAEPHHHDDSCYETERELICELEEGEHQHDESCYETERELICGLEESAELPEESEEPTEKSYVKKRVLVCGKEEQEPHKHTDACYEKVLDKEHPICGLEAHEHSLQCYSNPEADVETRSSWENTVAKAELNGNWAKDVLAVAETQIEYKESTENYEVQEDGTTTRGYTRYGEWCGDPYGEWSAMFAAFCLHYAGVDEEIMPLETDCDDWITALSDEKVDLYTDDDSYVPGIGDLVFFGWHNTEDEDSEKIRAERVGLVKKLEYDYDTKELTGIRVIEGALGDQVAERSYQLDSKSIMGYCRLPRNPEWFSMQAETKTGVVVTVEGLESSLPYPRDEIGFSAEEIASTLSADLLATRMEEDGIDDMARILLDVSLLCDGEAVEPVGPVYLSFATPDVDADSTVYHIDEENETVTEMSTEVNTIEGTVSLETEHFSTFALTLKAKSGKTVNATVTANWNPDTDTLSSVIISASSTVEIYFNYDVFNGESWTIGAGEWSDKLRAGVPAEFDITDLVNRNSLSTKYRVRVAQATATPENDKSGYSEEFSLYDILDAAKAGYSDWVADSYTSLFGGTRPTTPAQLFEAFAVYYELPELSLASGFSGGRLTVTASTGDTYDGSYVWQYYDEKEAEWVTLPDETDSVLDATAYSKLTDGADPLLDGGRTVRCLLYDGDELRAAATIGNINPLKEVYDAAIAEINEGLHLSTYSWYLKSGDNAAASKTANVTIGSTMFMDYFYYDNVARDKDVPFYDGESYANYLASEYLRVLRDDENRKPLALDHVKKIWDQYIFDIFNPNPGAGVVQNYSYYPGANGSGPISTYGDKIIEWPKDNASSFHNTTSGMPRNGDDGLIRALSYDFLEGGVDYSRFVQSVDKTATADAPGDNNTDRTYDVDITVETQATSVSPLAMLITVQTSWQMFDMAHANCVSGDGTYTSIEVGGAQHNTEMANLYDIKQAILRFIDYMDENFPGNNLVLGINEVQHGGSYNLINYSVGGGGNKKGGATGDIIYVSNNSELLRDSVYLWDSFGNCEHVHYDTDAMEDAAKNLYANLTGWVDIEGEAIRYSDINKVAVIIGGGTENSNGTNGYGCALPWGTFYSSDIDAVYGIRTNVGTPLNADGVLSWLDYSKNNTGVPYRLTESSYSSGSSTGNFTAKYVAPSEDAVFNYLVKIAQKELKTKGIKVQAEEKHIEELTISDTVTDEFRFEDNKPIRASIIGKNGKLFYETVITPTAYDANGNITAATAHFDVYEDDGVTLKTTTPAPVSVTNAGNQATLSISVDLPYDYTDGEDNKHIGAARYDQTLIIKQNSDRTTDVSYDFGTVYNTNDANLHFEVIARDDFIGCNNVFTNEDVPSVSFEHIKLDREGKIYIDPKTGGQVIVSDTVEGYDTPEVNVPVRFTANDGGSVQVEVKTPVNLEDLSTTPGGTLKTDAGVDSEYITAVVHDLIDNYDQITGTVSYTWVLPGGKEIRVPISLHVTNGDPDSSIPAASEMAQQWTPKASGVFDASLKVTFTPDPVMDNGNFANDGGVTATRVTELTREGRETILVENGEGSTASVTELTVTKVWSGEKGDTSDRPANITFNVLQDGEFYDQETVTAANGWKYTFTDLPYRDPDDLSHIYTYTVTEDAVSGYETSYDSVQTVQPIPYYWVEVPLADLELDGETEYMIVDKSQSAAIDAESTSKALELTFYTETDGDYPTAVDEDAASYFPDDGYHGWFVKYTDGSTQAGNYVKSAIDGTTTYIKKDGTFVSAVSGDTLLKQSPKTDGTIKLNDKYLLIKYDKGAYSLANDGDSKKASVFAFYEKVANTALPTYRTAVTNTHIPGGELPNETAIRVNKAWVNTESTPPITLHLLRNGKEIDSVTLSSSTGFAHTFDTLPGTSDKLPYFDPLTGEPYVYTVTEDPIDGYETGYTKTAVKDPTGGAHYVPFTESGGSSTELWDNTAYVFVASLTTGKGATAATNDYMIGGDGTGFAKTLAAVSVADDPNTTAVETFTFGTLTCSKEYTGTVPASAVWTVEQHTDPKGHETYLIKLNGQYLAVKKDNKTFQFTSTPTDSNPNCNFQFAYDSTTGTGKLYALTGDKYDTYKYLTLTVNDKGVLTAGVDGDAGKAAKFTVFEQVSLQSKYDTYAYEVQNISTATESDDGLVEYAKYIDYLSNNYPETASENPDTELQGDYYRLYLDAIGVRGEGAPSYPTFKGVSVTDHLSKYVMLAENGSKLALTVNKVSESDPENIDYLWYGNLAAATGNIGSAVGNGASVIKSVTYTRAAEDDDESSGMIRVEFMPDYCLEEGYRYVISYNVEASSLARNEAEYPDGSVGDAGTDYPGNTTSSGKAGYRSNSFADIVYTQNDEIKIGIFDHPVIQVITGRVLPGTGSAGPILLYTLGVLILSGALLCGWYLRRKHERRSK